MTRIDRRALFASGAAAALLAASGLSANAAPRPGGTLRLAVPRDGSLEQVATGALFDTLTELAPDGTLRGELATAWQGSPDARQWNFRLEQGVRFHDGTTLKPRHVVSALRASDLPGLVRAEVAGASRIALELDVGNPDLPLLLADPAFAIALFPGGGLAQGIGTGAYRLDRIEAERHFRASRVAEHYKAGRAGWADRIEIIVIPDAAVRAEALRDGFVDIAALPRRSGLIGRGEFLYHPSAEDMALAARPGVGIPRSVSTRAPLDDGRIAERWWLV